MFVQYSGVDSIWAREIKVLEGGGKNKEGIIFFLDKTSITSSKKRTKIKPENFDFINLIVQEAYKFSSR